MLAALLPSTVYSNEVFDGGCDEAELFPAEAALVEAASQQRRREFTGARACARLALARAGFAPAPIMPGPSGEPQWPAGAVGSITHCAGYRAAAVALTGNFAAIGIDAEPHAALPGGVLRMVASESEREMLAGLSARVPGVCWDKILFSAKESVFKAWFPMTGRWLGFADAEIEIDPSGTFAARLLVPGPVIGGRQISTYGGFWSVDRAIAVTAVSVPATD